MREALCTTGNGYFATRGAAPESAADGIHYPGTYIAGCYNELRTEIAGRKVANESLVNAPNWLPLTFAAEDGPWLGTDELDVLEHEQELDLRRGVLTRRLRIRDGQGRITRATCRRFVHMGTAHLAALETTIVPENWSGRLRVRSELNGTVENTGVARYRDLNSRHLVPVEARSLDAAAVLLVVETSQSHIRIAEAARTRLFRNGERVNREPDGDRQARADRPRDADPRRRRGRGDRREDRGHRHLAGPRDLGRGHRGSRLAGGRGLVRRNAQAARARMGTPVGAVPDRPAGQQGRRVLPILRLHIFHLLQTVSLNSLDRDVGIPARGLHGEAYRGHVFWDDLFVFPVLNLRIPELSRSLKALPLPSAGRGAASGDARPVTWVRCTRGSPAATGREQSALLHLNPKSGRWLPDTTYLQRHVGIAVAYSAWQYYQATGDRDFLDAAGRRDDPGDRPVLRQHRRLRPRPRPVLIRGVVGPDEFHTAYPDSPDQGSTTTPTPTS